MRVLFLLIFISITLNARCEISEVLTRDKYYEKAKSYYNINNYSECINFIEHGLKKDSVLFFNDNFLLLLSDSYINNHRTDAAKKVLISQLNKNLSAGNNFKRNLLLTESYYQELNIDSANHYLSLAENVIDHITNKESLGIFYLYKASLRINNNKEKKYSYFRRAQKYLLDRNSKVLDAYCSAGVNFVSDGKLDSGNHYLDKGLKLQKQLFPNDTLRLIRLLLQKGYTIAVEGDFNKSINLFEKTIRPLLFKKHLINENKYEFYKCEFYRLSVLIYSAVGDFGKCIKYGNEYLKLAPYFYPANHFRYGEVFRSLADSYYDINSFDTYLKYINKAIQILDNKDSYKHTVSYYKSRKFFVEQNLDSSLLWANNYIKKINLTKNLNSKVKEVLSNKFICETQLGKTKQSLDFLDSTIAINSGNFSSEFFLYEEYLKIISSNSNDVYTASIETNRVKKEIYNKIDSILFKLKENEIPYIVLYSLIYRNYIELNNTQTANLEFYLDESIRASSINKIVKGELPRDSKNIKDLYAITASTAIKSKYLLKKYEETNNINYLENSYKLLKYSKSKFGEYTVSNGSILDQIFPSSGFNVESTFLPLLLEISKQRNVDHEYFLLFEDLKSDLTAVALKEKNIRQISLLPDSISSKELYLKQRISYLKSKIKTFSPYSSSTYLINYKYNLELAEQELTILRNIIKNKFEFNKISNGNNYAVSYKEIKKLLYKEETLIHFYQGSQNTYALAISPTQTEFLKLDPLPDSLVQQFRNSLSLSAGITNAEENYQKYVQSAYAIYQSQLKPVLDKFPYAEKLYMIPDGNLHHIPFDALISELPTDSIVNYKKLNYLIRDYTISYANSATTLFKTKSLLNRLKTPGQNVLAYAPTYQQEEPLLATDKINKQPLSSIRGNLTNLKWNVKEVEEINKHFKGKFLTNSQATERSFQEQASKHDILHLSMHAIVDAEDPMYSYLAFAPDPNDTSSREGFLHAFEIYDMDLQAEMAVLSACNTGYGKIYKGEGPLSLAKAFTYAGCPSVVMSYWPADDKASSEIMGLFYSNLSEGMNKDVALRKAKLDFFENTSPLRQSPAFWNNFVVTGNVDPIVKDQTQLYVIVISAVILFFVLVWLGLRLAIRKRRLA